jgi:hypothetical protein
VLTAVREQSAPRREVIDLRHVASVWRSRSILLTRPSNWPWLEERCG